MGGEAAAPPAEDGGRVLSVQSHVVHGYVGNRCAGLVLQLLGLEVDVLNTVQFSNHTGYPTVKGQKLSGAELEELVDALCANGFGAGYTHFLTGYIGSVDFADAVGGVVAKLRKKNPALRYVLDPVMGDNGRLYVAEAMVPAFRRLVRHADVVTPNHFEAELLAETTIASVADAVGACRTLHGMGIRRVVLTSLELEAQPNELIIIGSDKEEGAFSLTVPKLGGYYTGTGDMMAAALLAWGAHEPGLAATLEKAVSCVQAAIRVTMEAREKAEAAERAARGLAESDELPKEACLNTRELRIVAARHAVMNPEVMCKAVRLDI